ncbi:MAG: DUF63 family protein [Candidatus Micrarchaeia archaeon]
MTLDEFIYRYYIQPIQQHTGYNPVNTLTYVVIALAAAYGIFLLLRHERIRIDRKFVLSIIPFILFGSTFRVLVDAVDTGVAATHRGALGGLFGKIVVDSGIYNYGYLTVTPGIYVVVGLLTLASVLVFNKLGKGHALAHFGWALWLTQLALFLPLAKNHLYFALVLALAVGGTLLARPFLRHYGVKLPLAELAVFSHALDGGATFVIIDIYNRLAGAAYFEQHVVGRWIGDVFGTMFAFYAIKVAFATAACVVLDREKDESEKMYILLLLVIFGLAPGVRDVLRLLAGA